MHDLIVNMQIVRKLAVEQPSEELVNAYLAEIAKGYKVEWSPPKVIKDGSDDEGRDGGGQKVGTDSFGPRDTERSY